MRPVKKATPSIAADCETCFRLAWLKLLGIDSRHSEQLVNYSVMHSLASDAAFLLMNFQRKAPDFSELYAGISSRLKQIDDFNLEQCIESSDNSVLKRDFLKTQASERKKVIEEYKKSLSGRLEREQKFWIESSKPFLEEIMGKIESDELKILFIREYGQYKSLYTDSIVGRPDGIVFFKKGKSMEIKVAPFEIKPVLDSRGIVQNAAYHVLLNDKTDYIRKLFENETGIGGKSIAMSDSLFFMEYKKMDAGITSLSASEFTSAARSYINLVNGWINESRPVPSAEEFYGKMQYCPRCYLKEKCSSQKP